MNKLKKFGIHILIERSKGREIKRSKGRKVEKVTWSVPWVPPRAAFGLRSGDRWWQERCHLKTNFFTLKIIIIKTKNVIFNI